MRRERYGLTRSSGLRKSQEAGKQSGGSLKESVPFRQWENLRQPAIRYDCYRLKLWEFALGIGKGAGVCMLISFTFYRSIKVFLWISPLALVGAATERRKRIRQRKKELAVQFKESMMIIAASLSAGFSIENALSVSVEELSMLYGRDGMIVQEYAFMVQ